MVEKACIKCGITKTADNTHKKKKPKMDWHQVAKNAEESIWHKIVKGSQNEHDNTTKRTQRGIKHLEKTTKKRKRNMIRKGIPTIRLRFRKNKKNTTKKINKQFSAEARRGTKNV